MISSARWVSLAVLLSVVRLAGQTTPTATAPLPAQSLTVGGAAVAVDLRSYFGLPSVQNTVVQFSTSLGRFNVEMRPDVAPRHVANFLAYVVRNDYTNSFIHRSSPIASPIQNEIIQGGGYRLPLVTTITATAPVPLEYNLPNAAGTLAAARTDDVNSATSQWFINVRDNSNSLGPSNGGGYSVFGRIIGNGLSIATSIANLPVVNVGSPFNQLPVRNFSGGTVLDSNLVLISSIAPVNIQPGSGASVISYTATSGNPAAAGVTVSGPTLTLTPGAQAGAATITVRATDTNGSFTQGTFDVSVTSPVVLPTITRSPQSQTVAAGAAVALEVVAGGVVTSYQWKKDGVALSGATGPLLILRGLGAGDAGTYTADAINAAGSVTSAGGTLTVAAGAETGRLSNLSLRSLAGVGAQTLTAGFSLSGAGTSNLLIRGIGPTLGVFGVTGALADPRLDLFVLGSSTAFAGNDNWSGLDGSSAGGFALPNGSRDAVVSAALAAGGYTAQVRGVNNTTGEALAEVYEIPGTGAAAELTNLSARTQLSSGQILTLGFSIGSGSARTVLIRAVGPGLGALGVPDTLADPRIELFGPGSVSLSANDDWGGGAVLTQLYQAVGAFGIADGGSKDAAMVVTLPSGGYTAQVSGVNGSSGVVIVEVYVVP